MRYFANEKGSVCTVKGSDASQDLLSVLQDLTGVQWREVDLATYLRLEAEVEAEWEEGIEERERWTLNKPS